MYKYYNLKVNEVESKVEFPQIVQYWYKVA